ncbi:hypothetical protein [Staphylococcus equorum]|uniref:hypothetical protein n=2 Tax=Staphylococcus equorum TaxID=246432 RepID=UPI0015FA74C3|nr:hypothetical protein [Staphylococcus equorum]
MPSLFFFVAQVVAPIYSVVAHLVVPIYGVVAHIVQHSKNKKIVLFASINEWITYMFIWNFFFNNFYKV